MSFQRISIVDAKALIDEQQANVVDVRDPQSFAVGHIENATHLTNDNLASYIEQTEKEKPLIVVCYHGNSSQQAAQYLASQGFVDVYSMDGGMEAWKLQFEVSQ